MNLIRYEYPLGGTLADLDAWFDRALTDLERWTVGQSAGPAARTIPVDLFEDKQGYHLRAELPGVKREAIKLELDNRVLTLTAEFVRRAGTGDRRIQLARSVNLPDDIDPDAIKARLEHGLLTVSIPRAEHRKPRPIAVN